MAKLIGKLQDFPQRRPDEDWEEFHKREAAAFTELENASDALQEGDLVGFVMRFQVADGYASYVVTKSNPRSVELAYIPFGDNYQAHPALIRGLRRSDVLREQASRQKLAEVYGFE